MSKSRSNDIPPVAAVFSSLWGRLSLLLLILVLAGFTVFGNDGGLLQVLSLKNEKERLEQEVQQLQNQKETLEIQIEHLESSDPFSIESEARLKGMVRKGEEVYKLEYDSTTATSTLKK